MSLKLKVHLIHCTHSQLFIDVRIRIGLTLFANYYFMKLFSMKQHLVNKYMTSYEYVCGV